MLIKSILSVFTIILILSSCTNSAKEATTEKADSISNIATISDQQKNKVYADYTVLKSALFESNVKDVAQAANVLARSLEKIDGCKPTSVIADGMSKSNDVEQQRKLFVGLSSDVVSMFKTTNIASGSIFVQYCPMANDGNGAYWLASEKEIKNPFYGNDMLTCGEVKQVLQ